MSAPPPSSDVASSSGGLPKLPTVINRLGCGMAQIRSGILGGGVFMADGAELLLISTVTDAVSTQWNLGPFERGFVVAIVFVGILLGNLISGPVGDIYGRRLPILLSYVGIVVFSFLSSWAWSFLSLCAFRLAVGVSYGAGQPSYNAMQAEITPAKYRLPVSGVFSCLFSLGEIYSALIIMAQDPYMKNIEWRSLLQMGALPAVFFGIGSFFFLRQSPAWLAVVGRYDDAIEVLEGMKRDNKADDVSVEFCPPKSVGDSSEWREALWRQLSVIFSKQLMLTTGIVMYSTFVLNFVFYGCLYAFPQVMSEVNMAGTPAGNLLVGALWEILGTGAGVLVGMKLGRKMAIKGYLGMEMTALIAFAFAAPTQDPNFFLGFLLYGGYFGIKFFCSFGFLIVYQYTSEVFPTEARTSGIATCLAGGRLAGIIAPLAFEAVQQASGFETFFYLLAAFAAMNFLLIDFLPYETAGVELSDRLEVSEKESLKERLYGEIKRRAADNSSLPENQSDTASDAPLKG